MSGTEVWLTWPQAAALVGCPVPTIDWHTRSGRILTRPHRGPRPTVSRSSAEEFATWWNANQERQAERRLYRYIEVPPEPTGWVTSDQAADIRGKSRQTTIREMKAGAFPSEKRGRRWFILESALRTHTAERDSWVSRQGAMRITGAADSAIRSAVRSGEIKQRATGNRALPSLDRASVEAFGRSRALPDAADRER